MERLLYVAVGVWSWPTSPFPRGGSIIISVRHEREREHEHRSGCCLIRIFLGSWNGLGGKTWICLLEASERGEPEKSRNALLALVFCIPTCVFVDPELECMTDCSRNRKKKEFVVSSLVSCYLLVFFFCFALQRAMEGRNVCMLHASTALGVCGLFC